MIGTATDTANLRQAKTTWGGADLPHTIRPSWAIPARITTPQHHTDKHGPDQAAIWAWWPSWALGALTVLYLLSIRLG